MRLSFDPQRDACADEAWLDALLPYLARNRDLFDAGHCHTVEAYRDVFDKRLQQKFNSTSAVNIG